MKYKVRETENVIKIDLDKIRSMFGGGGGGRTHTKQARNGSEELEFSWD